MLRIVDDNNHAGLLSFCVKDAFGTRIAAYYQTYGTGFAFAVFYFQEIDGKATAAVGRIDDQMTICCDANADFDELSEFLQAIGYESLLCDASICTKLQLKQKKTGSVVEYKRVKSTTEKFNITVAKGFELSDIYGILKRSDFDGLSDYLPWLTDVAHRLKQGTAKVIAAEEQGKAVACAMVVFETRAAAVLGAVATLPEFRGKGYAGALVTTLAGEIKEKNKRVNLLCAEGTIIDFYKKLGFEKTGEWVLI